MFRIHRTILKSKFHAVSYCFGIHATWCMKLVSCPAIGLSTATYTTWSAEEPQIFCRMDTVLGIPQKPSYPHRLRATGRIILGARLRLIKNIQKLPLIFKIRVFCSCWVRIDKTFRGKNMFQSHEERLTKDVYLF